MKGLAACWCRRSARSIAAVAWLAAVALQAATGEWPVVPPAGADYLAWKRGLLAQRGAKSAKDVFISNPFVRLGVGFEGAWGLGTTGGDPADPNDDNLDLTFSLTGSSNSLALKVDGTLHILDGSLPEVTRAADGSHATATWTVDGMQLRALYELVDNGSGRADTAKVTYTVTNPARKTPGAERSVSLKLGLDIDVANAYARLLTPAGAVAVETGFGQTGGGAAYPLPAPDFWQGFQHDSLAEPGLVGQGTLAGGGATRPDKVVIGAWPAVSAGSNFDYAPSSASYGDSAVALWWFDRPVPAGASVSFVVLYGIGQMSRSSTAGLALGVSAPASLGSAGSVFAPNPFSVVAQVQNRGAVDLLDLPVTIALPSGLSVAAGGSATQTIGSLAAGASAVVTFHLAASPDYAGQVLGYRVRAGSGPGELTLDRTITLPAAAREVTITFLAGAGGSLSGLAVQTLTVGSETTAVTAVPGYGFVFQQWDDGSTANPRTVANVTVDQALTAQFREASLVPPNGEFLAVVTATNRGVWDLSGTYALTVAGYPLVLDLLHDVRGTLTGQATYTVGKVTLAGLSVRGSARGTASSTVVQIALRGADPARTVNVALALRLTLNAGTRQLAGALTGSVTNAGIAIPVTEPVVLSIPAPMDGSWTLLLRLTPSGRVVSGTALLTLSNGVDYAYDVRGRTLGSAVVLSLSCTPAGALLRGGTMHTTVTTREGHWATLQAFSARAYGQALTW